MKYISYNGKAGNSMRKILVAALALLLAFPLTSPAFAEDSPGAAAAEAGLVLPVDEGVPDGIS